MTYDMDKFLMIDKGNKEFESIKVNLRWQGLGGKIKDLMIYDPNKIDAKELEKVDEFSSIRSRGAVAGDILQVPEHPTVAMRREFKEEAESDIKFKWHCFVIKEYKGIKIYCFAAFCSPNDLHGILHKHAENGFVTREGQLAVCDMIDIFFDPQQFTFDLPYMMQMIVKEVKGGFFPKLDPEGVNSSAPPYK